MGCVDKLGVHEVLSVGLPNPSFCMDAINLAAARNMSYLKPGAPARQLDLWPFPIASRQTDLIVACGGVQKIGSSVPCLVARQKAKGKVWLSQKYTCRGDSTFLDYYFF